MIDCKELSDLPLLPRDEEGPVFEEPWQAQAFAVVVKLNEAGLITWKEWAQCLGSVFQEAESRGEYDTGKRYYEHWLTALERFAREKNLAQSDELEREEEEILARFIEHTHEHEHEHEHGHTHEHSDHE
jgi:nitrile hydratase accessory protein